MLTPVEERLREELSNPNNRLRSQRAVVNSDDGKWPNGIVPYEIDNSLSECTECGSLMFICVAGGWCHTLVGGVPHWWVVYHIGGKLYSVRRSYGQHSNALPR